MTVNPTLNYKLSRPNFNSMSWHDETNGNFTVIDALFKAIGLANVSGAWTTGTLYNIGDRVVDPITGVTWQAAVSNTSGSGTMAEDIAANPSWWAPVSTGVVVREAFVTGVTYNVGDFVYQTSEYLAGIVETGFVGGATLRTNIANLGIIYDIKTAMTTITGAVTQTGLDRVATAADRVQTGLDRVATSQDKVATAADRVQTGLDRAQTGADRTQTGLDRVATNNDKIATAADRVQTGLDRTAASNSAAAALTSENNAAATLATAIKSDMVVGATNRVIRSSGTSNSRAKDSPLILADNGDLSGVNTLSIAQALAVAGVTTKAIRNITSDVNGTLFTTTSGTMVQGPSLNYNAATPTSCLLVFSLAYMENAQISSAVGLGGQTAIQRYDGAAYQSITGTRANSGVFLTTPGVSGQVDRVTVANFARILANERRSDVGGGVTQWAMSLFFNTNYPTFCTTKIASCSWIIVEYEP